MRKFIPAVAAVVALAGSAVCGILWVNNLVSAWRYHVQLAHGGAVSADAFPPGIWPWLNWSVVDVSTVTTLIPFFGFLLILHGLLHIDHREEWPFFTGYDRLNIALGLLGTIWGIILVGYYPGDQITIAALMRCLHTAMFSTLMAVAWVMVVLPVAVMPVMRLCRRLQGGAVSGIDSIGELAEEFTRHIADAGGALENSTAQLRRFQAGAADSADAVATLHAELAGFAAEAAAARESEADWQRNAAGVIREFAAAGEQLAELQKALAAENRALALRNGQLETELAELAGRNRTLAGQLAESESAVTGLRRTVEAIRQALR